MADLSLKHFSPYEFECGCGCWGGIEQMNTVFLGQLDGAREIAGVPFELTSAYRCESHNGAVGGVRGSAHTRGVAVDIAVASGRERFVIVQSLIHVGIKRVGIADSFVHADVDPEKPQEVMWLYG